MVASEGRAGLPSVLSYQSVLLLTREPCATKRCGAYQTCLTPCLRNGTAISPAELLLDIAFTTLNMARIAKVFRGRTSLVLLFLYPDFSALLERRIGDCGFFVRKTRCNRLLPVILTFAVY